jgi:hypothetical protein
MVVKYDCKVLLAMDRRLKEIVLDVARKRRESINSFIRKAIMSELARLGYLSSREMKALGLIEARVEK